MRVALGAASTQRQSQLGASEVPAEPGQVRTPGLPRPPADHARRARLGGPSLVFHSEFDQLDPVRRTAQPVREPPNLVAAHDGDHPVHIVEQEREIAVLGAHKRDDRSAFTQRGLQSGERLARRLSVLACRCQVHGDDRMGTSRPGGGQQLAHMRQAIPTRHDRYGIPTALPARARGLCGESLAQNAREIGHQHGEARREREEHLAPQLERVSRELRHERRRAGLTREEFQLSDDVPRPLPGEERGTRAYPGRVPGRLPRKDVHQALADHQEAVAGLRRPGR